MKSDWTPARKRQWFATLKLRVAEPTSRTTRSWRHIQRTKYLNNELDSEQIEALDGLGWLAEKSPNDYLTQWSLKYNQFIKDPDNKTSKQWIVGQRRLYKDGKLSSVQIEALQPYGLDENQASIIRWYKTLRKNLINYNTSSSRSWRSRQRLLYKEGKLCRDRVIALRELGWLAAQR